MPAEKKKLMIIGILAVIILCVGAFSLKGGGSAPAPKPAAGHHKRHDSADTAGAPTAVGTNPGLGTASTKLSSSAAPLNEASGTPAASVDGLSKTPAGTASSTANPTGSASAPVAEQDFPERDPFDGRKFTPPDPTKTPSAPAAPSKVASATTGGPKGLGKVPPLAIDIDTKGSLPATSGNSKMELKGLSNATAVPAKEPDFDYTVSGVITGDRSAAVFVDSKGNQRLISLGGSVDGDTTVAAISRTKVTVVFHGKKRNLSVGADTPTEKHEQ